jgi:hypothetical protein
LTTKAERAETLRVELELLLDCRRRVQKYAPLVGSDTGVWLDRLRDYMRAELKTLAEPADKTYGTRVAWAVLYAMYERANSVTASPGEFARVAGLAVRTLNRMRNAAPTRVKAVFRAHPMELRSLWTNIAKQLDLKGKRRAEIRHLLFPKKRPRDLTV